jgi:hypothetical protein
MRKSLLVAALGIFAVWFLVKGLPFLLHDRPAIWQTPTSTPQTAADLLPVTATPGGQLCVDGMPWAPQARYVQVTLLPGVHRTAPAVDVVASAPGYRATGRIPAGLRQNAKAYVKIAPAPREVNGTLCLVNRGARPLAFYGVPRNGRLPAPVKVTLDGVPFADRQVSVTLLTNPSQPILGRLGDILDHVAAFRPLAAWEVWLLALALVLGTPVAVAVALARAGALDDDESESRS